MISAYCDNHAFRLKEADPVTLCRVIEELSRAVSSRSRKPQIVTVNELVQIAGSLNRRIRS